MRKFCKDSGAVEINGLSIDISGTGSWKTLLVSNMKTGEVIEEKKFHKSDFATIWNSPQYSQYVNTVFNVAYMDICGKSIDINDESYEEIRQIAMTLEEG